MTRHMVKRALLGAMTVAAIVATVPVAVGARQATNIAELRAQLQQRYDLLSLQDGVGLVPRDQNAGARIIEIRDGTVSIDGQTLTGGELRARVGDDAGLILRVSYLDATQQRELAGGTAPAAAPEGAPAAASESAPAAAAPAAERPQTPRRTRRGEIVRFGNDVTVAEDEVVEEVVVIGGNATINGEVAGELTVIGGNATLGPTAVVREDLTVVGGRLDRAPGAVVEGRIEEVDAGGRWWAGPMMFGRPFASRVGHLAGTLARVSLIALLAVALVAFGRRWIEEIADRTAIMPVRAGVTGFLAELLFIPVLIVTVVVLAISIIGIPLLVLIPFAIVLVVIGAVVGFTGAAYQAGRLLNARFGWPQRGPYVTVLIGVAAITTLTILARFFALAAGGAVTLPFVAIGLIVEYLAWTLGFGAAILMWHQRWQQRRAPAAA